MMQHAASSDAAAFDAIVVGAGAAGLMCALRAGQRGRRVLLLDHADEPGKKILISGGGRCNFTNEYAAPDRFHSANPRFAVVAKYPHLDQAVHIKPGIDFFHDRGRQAGVSDQYNGLESVGLGAQFAALCWSEFQHKNPLKAVF